MATTISAPQTLGVTLSALGQNPVTITGAGGVGVAAGPAIYGSAAYAWTITNAGAVSAAAAANGFGILLRGGGTVANAQAGSGVISGGLDAIYLHAGAAGAYVNNGFGGTIAGGLEGVLMTGTSPGTVLNGGTISALGASSSGVGLLAGGVVANGGPGVTSALISGDVGLFGSSAAVGLTNFGTILGSTLPGVVLNDGGIVVNGAGGDPAALIGGNGGVYMAGAFGSVSNAATIRGSGTFGVALIAGGAVSNGDSGNTAALISGGVLGVGISGGTIYIGVTHGAPGTVENLGTILGTGVTSAGAGISGSGTIINGSAGATAALMMGASYGVAVDMVGFSPSTVVNFGTIIASGAAGIGVGVGDNGTLAAQIAGPHASGNPLYGLATVTNFGVIRGATGVGGGTNAHSATVINAGTILGTAGTAVGFAAGNDVVVIEPGAVFGGNVVASTTGSNRLELGAGTAAGTIAGIGSPSFANFATVAVDAGAQWSLPASNHFISGITLGNAGTVLGSVTLQGGAAVNHADGTIAGAIYAGAGSATVINAGTILGVAAGAVLFAAGNDLMVVQPGAVFGGNVVASSTGANTLDLALVLTGTGAAAGTITGIGSTAFANFATIKVDPGAEWTLAGANTVAKGVTLSGGAIPSYASVVVTGSLTNQGGIGGTLTLNGGTVANDSGATIAGAVYGAGAGVLTNRGKITSANMAVDLNASGKVDNLGVIQGGTYGVGTGIRLSGGGTVSNGSATNTTAAISSGYRSVRMYGNDVLDNFGTISATGAIGTGARLDSGSLTNGSPSDTTASITATTWAVAFDNAGVITNFGTIAASSLYSGAYGIILSSGGNIANGAVGDRQALISGGIRAAGPASVANDGTITGSYAGAAFNESGTVMNDAGGLISGGMGVRVGYAGGVVTNAGTIIGTAGAAVMFAGGNDRIVFAPGAVFMGQVAGSATGANTLELAAGTAAGALVGFGTAFTDFGTVLADQGATWDISGTVTAGQTLAFGGVNTQVLLTDADAMAGEITGFAATDQLTLAGITDTNAATLGAGNVLTVTRSGGAPIMLRFDSAQMFPGTQFPFSVSGIGTTLVMPCFAAGTRIATAGGEVAVEDLRQGDRLVLARGGRAPVVWIGRRTLACRRYPRPAAIMPVRIRAGAFREGVPSRDLWLSPDHAVFADGVLIPVRMLVNRRTIVQLPVKEVTYFHVELAAHDVLLAEGLACESYLDTGNRAAFAGAVAVTTLHPDFAGAVRERRGCAPLVLDGPEVHAVRAALLARADALGSSLRRVS